MGMMLLERMRLVSCARPTNADTEPIPLRSAAVDTPSMMLTSGVRYDLWTYLRIDTYPSRSCRDVINCK